MTGSSLPLLALVGGAGSQSVELGVFFVIGLLGGAHCLGMCGPLVSMYAEQLGSDPESGGTLSWRHVRQHALFNTGRTLSYGLIGAVFGLVGLVVFRTATVTHVGNTVRGIAGVAIGTFIVVVGIYRLLGDQGGPLTIGAIPGLGGAGRLFAVVTGRIRGRVGAWVGGPGIVLLGAMHGLLPCPLTYPAFLYAFSQGTPVWGFVDLVALGLGTFPTLFLYGTVLGSVPVEYRVALHRVLGAAFLVLGYIPLAMGLNLLGVPVPMLKPPFYQPLV
ncbi:MAG: sulfite exporter TauE/SafE family protein [Haloarculaceae archaeon]